MDDSTTVWTKPELIRLSRTADGGGGSMNAEFESYNTALASRDVMPSGPG